MNQSRIALFSLVLGIATLTLAAPVVRAQAASAGAPTHIAVVNLKEAYSKLGETKDLQAKLAGMNDDLTRMQNNHKVNIEDYQHQISQVKVDSPQHDEMMSKFDDMQLDFKRLEALQQVKMSREQAHQIIKAYTEIQAAVADLAKKRGYDLVITNSDTEIPSNAGDIANLETVANLIFNRNVIFVSDKVNITADVIAAVDAAHAAAASGH